MKTQLRLLAVVAVLPVATLCQAQDRIVGKLFIVDASGDVRHVIAGKVLPMKAGDTIACKNVTFEAGAESSATGVLSNNTGLYIAPDSRFAITRFEQAPFAADPNRVEDEPSVSNFEGVFYSGTFAFCFANQVFGSTAKYTILGAEVNVRGKRVVVDASDSRTILYIVDGEATVFSGPDDRAGVIARSNKQMSITPGVGGEFPIITVSDIDADVVEKLNNSLSAACLARRAVFFATPEDPLRVLPPPQGPTPPTVSIDRLGG